jgi:hypothetical protein
LLRWQEEEAGSSLQSSSSAALTQWQTQAGPNLQNLLPGCGIELLLPGAYYVACREADKAIRPISLRAAVNYLTTALATEPGQLEVIIAGFGDEANAPQTMLVQVARSSANREELARSILVDMLLPMSSLVLLMTLIVWLGIRAGLSPF